ncbi:hypothetical protein L1887_18189 [Cichorium endivia]|nr:hypothetical protein L1887_18189 [Cichorium endivia]
MNWEEWEEKSDDAKKIRAKYQYTHRLSRKGYVGLIVEIMEQTGMTEEEINRALLWKKAREMKNGDEPVEELLDNSCYLTVDVASNIVAKGTIMEFSYLGENIEVMMELCVQGEVSLPIPLEEEFIVKVKDVVGHILSWPRHLVIQCSDLGKATVKPMEKKANLVKEKELESKKGKNGKENQTRKG